MNSENHLFSGAVAVSLLVHVAVLLFAHGSGSTGREKSITPTVGPFEVALVSAKASVVRAEAQRESRRSESAERPARQRYEPVESKSEAQPMPVPKRTGVESTSTKTTDINAPVADANALMDKPVGANAAKTGEPAIAPVGAADTASRDHYLASVLSLIETHKFYPTAARRHGLQGRVDVRFTLDARGGISDLDVTGSHSMLVVAARDAINSAMPLPAAPSAVGFPMTVHYQMIFKLQ